MATRHLILIYTKDPSTRHSIHESLSDSNDWLLFDASSAEEAMDLMAKHGDALSLLCLDARLMDDSMWDALRRHHTPRIVDNSPALLLVPSDFDNAAVPQDIFISDTISLPVQPAFFYRRVKNLIKLHAYQKKDVAYQHPVSRDPLLGLLNGSAISKAINEALSTDTGGLFAYVNLDGMRAINERSGHHFGDVVLVDAAAAIAKLLPDNAVLGRVRGDTFCALVPGSKTPEENILLMEMLKAALYRVYPDAPGGQQLVTACVGVSSAPENGTDFDALYECAAIAGLTAKQTGRNVLLFYSDSMRDALQAERLFAPENPEDTNLITDGYFIPVLAQDGVSICQYDYITFAENTDPSSYQRAMKRASALSPRTVLHLLRRNVRHFFYMLHLLQAEGVTLPPTSFYAVLQASQSDMLPQILKEVLSEYTVDPSDVCINLPQEMTLDMDTSHLESLVRDIRALGFRVGIHNVGDGCIAAHSFQPGLFDHMLIAPNFLQAILDGTYPSVVLDHVVAIFGALGMQLTFPSILSASSRMVLVQTLNHFGSYSAGVLKDAGALAAHIQSHTQRAVVPLSMLYSAFRIGEDRYNEIFTQSGIIIFDWRPHQDTIAFSASYEAIHGHPNHTLSLFDLSSLLLHPDEVSRFQEMMYSVKHGHASAEGIFRVQKGKDAEPDTYHWRRFFATPSYQEDGIVSHVYCISIDVDREQRKVHDYMEKAERDPLTKLLNRSAMEARVCEFLSGEGKGGNHAVMFVDIDDFKLVNDRLGHQTGDEVLQYLSDKMQSLFRKDDWIARVGGDEFLVFMRNVPSQQLIAARAEDICNAARNAPPSWELSVTVGIARYPDDADTYTDLYAKSDIAMYAAKEGGKNRWAFYDGE